MQYINRLIDEEIQQQPSSFIQLSGVGHMNQIMP